MMRERFVSVLICILLANLLIVTVSKGDSDEAIHGNTKINVTPKIVQNQPLVDVSANKEEGLEHDNCQSIDDDSWLFADADNQTILTWPDKHTKFFDPKWRASSRRGLRSVVTTLYSVHVKESVPILNNQLPPEWVLDDIFRCRGFGERKRLDSRLVETVVETARHFNAPRIEIISGYRSPKFNDTLAKKGRHVAVESKHTRGRALDFRVVETPAKEVGHWLWKNFDGGIGTYMKDDFVHIDTGPKRRWNGR